MKIPSEVIDDLLPLYQDGELSNASRQLVEEYLAEHPERAASLSAAEALHMPKIDAPPDIEMKSLDRTTRLLEQKSIAGLLALAISCAQTIDQPYVLYKEEPWAAAVFLLASLGLWIRFLLICKKLSGTGLQPSASSRARFLWFCGASMASIPFCFAFAYWTGWPFFHQCPIIFGSVGLMAGTWVGQIADTRIKT
jgi:hypothetical protein